LPAAFPPSWWRAQQLDVDLVVQLVVPVWVQGRVGAGGDGALDPVQVDAVVPGRGVGEQARFDESAQP
jgi:hypothetical protein